MLCSEAPHQLRNFADLALDGEEDEAEFREALGNKTGFVAGGFIEVPVSQAFSFAPEVLFTQKGAKAEVGGGEITISTDQLQVPVLFKANFSGGSVRPFVTVGPAFGFKTSSKSSSRRPRVCVSNAMLIPQT
jgi:hypothetical protein